MLKDAKDDVSKMAKKLKKAKNKLKRYQADIEDAGMVSHVREVSTPLNPTFILKNWGLQGYIYFSYFCSKT